MTMRTDPDAQAMQAALEADLRQKMENAQRSPIGTGYVTVKPETVLGLLDSITTLRSRLAEGGEAEPVAWYSGNKFYGSQLAAIYGNEPHAIPLYRTPPTHTAAVQAALTHASKELADHIQHAGSPLEAGTWRAASEVVAEIKPEDVLGGGK